MHEARGPARAGTRADLMRALDLQARAHRSSVPSYQHVRLNSLEAAFKALGTALLSALGFQGRNNAQMRESSAKQPLGQARLADDRGQRSSLYVIVQ